MPMKTEITPLLIITKLEQYDYAGATAIAVVMLRRVVRDAARDQPAAVRGRARRRRRAGMTHHNARRADPCRPRTGEARWVRWLLIARRAGLPRAVPVRAAGGRVSRGVPEGARRLLDGVTDPDAWSADPADAARRGDRGAAEPGVRPRRRVGDRQVQFPRQEPADHADRPAVLGVAGHLGPDLRAAVRRAGLVRPVAARARHQDHLRRARHRAGDDLRHVPVRRARTDSADAGAGHRARKRRRSCSARAAGRRSGASRCRTSSGGCSTA